MKKLNYIFLYIKNRYFLALAIVLIIFILNYTFPVDNITSESCVDHKCNITLEVPQLTDHEPLYFANDVFNSSSKEYYRLTFQLRSTAESKIYVKITNPLDQEREIKTLVLQKTSDDKFHEILFSTDDNQKYTDLLFEKVDKNDRAEISISSIQITKLNVSSEKEFASFKLTIRGEIDYDVLLMEQPNNSSNFDQLKDRGILFGQFFKAPAEYITGIVLDFNIIKQSNIQNKKYTFEIREVNYEEGGPPEIRSIILASLEFSLADLDKYRQEDGKYKFPIFARVEKGKHYFFGIDNEKLETNQFNYLSLKGNSDGNEFDESFIALKNKGNTYRAAGDLYFKVLGTEFKEHDGEKILGGTVISDIGKGKGIFKYQPKNSIYDMADLYIYTPDIQYDANKKALAGEVKETNDSYFIYKFETIFPFNKFRIFGKQPDINWSKTAIYYSYDKENWQDIPSKNVEQILPNKQSIQNIQAYNHTIIESVPRTTIYLKLQPINLDAKDSDNWGISNFLFEAELIMK